MVHEKPGWWRWFWLSVLVGFVVWLLISLGAVVFAEDDGRLWGAVSTLMALVAGAFWLRFGASVAFSARVDDGGLEGRSLNGRRWELAWGEVGVVKRYVTNQQLNYETFILVPKNGRTIRLGSPMSDFHLLADAIETNTAHAERQDARLWEHW